MSVKKLLPLILVGLLAACGKSEAPKTEAPAAAPAAAAPAPAPVAAVAADGGQGEALFKKTCAMCHQTGVAGRCYHLVDPQGYRVGDVLDIFSRAAHAPKMNVFVNTALLGFIPRSVKKGLMSLAPVRRIRNAVLSDLGLPEDILTFVNYPHVLTAVTPWRPSKAVGWSAPT